jgi:hypothetical protein
VDFLSTVFRHLVQTTGVGGMGVRRTERQYVDLELPGIVGLLRDPAAIGREPAATTLNSLRKK